MHDLKGHLTHLLTELPNIFVGEPQKLCTELLEGVLFSRKEGGYTGADLRVALLEVYKFLYSQDVEDNIKQLIQTAAKISEILYSPEEQRSPKRVLQLCMASP